MQHDQIPIGPVNTERGLKQKVIRHGVRSAIVLDQVVPIRRKELFYLRAILQTRPAFSFEGLRTVAGVCHPTYALTATALGLFRDVREAEYALQDSISTYHRPSQLRFLFANLVPDLTFPRYGVVVAISKSICLPISACTTIQHEPLI